MMPGILLCFLFSHPASFASTDRGVLTRLLTRSLHEPRSSSQPWNPGRVWANWVHLAEKKAPPQLHTATFDDAVV